MQQRFEYENTRIVKGKSVNGQKLENRNIGHSGRI